jgi:parallel beta-helix repeat protein
VTTIRGLVAVNCPGNALMPDPLGQVSAACKVSFSLVGLKIAGPDGPPGFGGLEVSERVEAEVTDCSISKACIYGIHVRGSARASITDCSVSESPYGIVFQDSAWGSVTNCTVSACMIGVGLGDSARVSIADCSILACREYGVALLEKALHLSSLGTVGRAPSQSTSDTFTGYVRGGGNVISDIRTSAVFPSDLNFLMTPSGGELSRRATP